jgi:hypothetical protein
MSETQNTPAPRRFDAAAGSAVEWEVTGYAMVPVKVCIRVTSTSKEEAEDLAMREFDRPTRRSCRALYVESNSEDYSAVHSWAPFAEPAKPLSAIERSIDEVEARHARRMAEPLVSPNAHS